VTESSYSEGVRRAAMAGAIGPIGFLAMSFMMAALRPEVIRAQGWASWPSSMAVGGGEGLGQTVAFLWLAACYVVFAVWALRPAIDSAPVTWGYLAIACGDVLLAFPTDPPGADLSAQGALHIAGVFVTTVATVVATLAVTQATRPRPEWRPWRVVAWVPLAASAVVLLGLIDGPWGKVAFVVGITLPSAMVAWLVWRDADERVRAGLT
jgi:hypothetical protein